MKEFEIKGKLIVNENLDHQEVLGKLFEELKKLGLHFSGETRDITNENK